MVAGMADYSSIIRPKYGAAFGDVGDETVVATDTTSLLTVTGKGMIYGGLVLIDYTASQAFGKPILKVDGHTIAEFAIWGMRHWNVTKHWSYPIYLLCFDDVNYVYAVAVSHGITFESSFELLYEEQDGGTPLVVWQLCYALI